MLLRVEKQDLEWLVYREADGRQVCRIKVAEAQDPVTIIKDGKAGPQYSPPQELAREAWKIEFSGRPVLASELAELLQIMQAV